jgi:4-amino-4-deoxy-L-arabinose transferase-like glycosyltransferase
MRSTVAAVSGEPTADRHAPTPGDRAFWIALGGVAMAGLAVRVVAVLTWSRHFDPAGDQRFYWWSGQDLADGFGFVYRNNLDQRVTTAIHPPLYSMYLGVASALGFDSHAWHRLFSTLLGAACVVVVGLAARRWAGRRAGIFAAACAAVYPNLWLNDVALAAETMYALMIALVLLAAIRLWDRRRMLDVVVLSVAIALATLSRAEGLVLFVVLLVPLVLWCKDQPWARRIAMVAVAAVVGLVVMGPWLGRNLTSFTNPVLVSSGGGFVIEIANCDQTYGLDAPRDASGAVRPGTDNSTFLGYWTIDCDRSDRNARGDAAVPWPEGDESVVEASKRKIGTEYALEHLDRVPVVVAARLGRMWDLWRPEQSYDFNRFYERRGDNSTKAAMAMYYALLPLGLAGAVILRRRGRPISPFVAIAAATSFAAAISFGITRYRVGADVALCVLAGVTLSVLSQKVIRARGPASSAETVVIGEDADE